MLVINPAKRLTIGQIKAHKWFADCGVPATQQVSPVTEIPKPIGEFNEQALRLMQSLGIDQQKTIDVSLFSSSAMMILSVESQKGDITSQRCIVENQKAAIAIDIVYQLRPSGSQQNIFEYW